ncbi:MAG: ATP-binding cassette domain-containing protein [Hyphomicrobiales bacterium]
MDKNLFRYIWRNTRRQQIWILFIVLLSMPTYFMSFDLPKQIVNGPIQGDGFETPGATATFLKIDFDVPSWISSSGNLVLFEGVQLNRFQMLMALSGLFLLLVIINGLFKFYINTYKGRLGERMLRRIRYELVDRVLRFPPGQFKRVKAPEVATMIKDEVEPLGGFIGDAFVQPALLGGQAVTALVFIIVQNFWLGMLAGGTVAVQGFIIPKLRRRLILLGRERQLTARELAGRVGEIVDGISAIHTNDTSNYERADIGSRLGRIFKIRYDIYQWKFFVKFLNNFIAQVTPFLFYAIGGYLALQGRMDVGQLVAVIAAYKDLPSPIKDLIDWDQQRVDVQVKYTQVVEQFTVSDLLSPQLQKVSKDPLPDLQGNLAVNNLSAVDESGAKLLDKATFTLAPGERLAIAGAAGSGGDTLAEAVVSLVHPENGRVTLEGSDIAELPEAITGRRFSYVSSDAHLMQGSFGDNLIYALKHAPFVPAHYEGADAKHREWEISEAQAAGNPILDIRDDWVDYASAGVANAEELTGEMQRVLELAGLLQDVVDLGLRTTIDPKLYPAIAEGIENARKALRAELAAEGISDFVISFDPSTYNSEATVVENLIFGAVQEGLSDDDKKAYDKYIRSVIEKFGLQERLYRMGYEIAKTVVDLFRDLPPDHPFFEQLTFMPAEEIPRFEGYVQRYKDKSSADVPQDDRDKIIALSFAYVEPRHRFGLLDDELRKRIVEARVEFRNGLPEALQRRIAFYDPKEYNRASNLLNNVLFGRITYERTDSADRVLTVVRNVLEEQGLGGEVFQIGLNFNVGSAGKRLTVAQRQKLHLARALLKRADFMILNRPLSALDLKSQERTIERVLASFDADGYKPGIMWVVGHASLARHFDRVAVFDGPTLAETGSFDELVARKGLLTTLLT